MQSEKKISVIINCLNGKKYLRKCIESVLNQNYQNLEIIFWDNNSSDNSIEVVKEFKDERIKLYRSTKTEKLYDVRNKAIYMSSGELISFLDCDDWWDPEFLSSRKKIFNDLNYDFFYSNTNFYYEKTQRFKAYKKNYLPSGNILEELVKDYFIIISGLILRKKVFSDIGYFNKDYNIIGDYDFVLKLAQNFNAHSDNRLLINYRVHQDNFSKKNRRMFYLEYEDWYKKNAARFNLRNKVNQFIIKLSYLEISYLIEEEKNLDLLIKILKHKKIIEKIKFLVLFFLPIKIILKVRK